MGSKTIFIQSPELQIPSRALTLHDSSLALRNLKFSFLPNIPPFQTLTDSLFFTLNGRCLPDSTVLQSSKIAPFSVLCLRLRLRGGGGDGGSTGAESRDCYLNMYAVKKPDKIDPNERRLSKWLNCALSYEPLKHPVVMDKLGNLFNKEALVEALLAKNLPKASWGHVKGLKDIIPVELSLIPGLDSRSELNIGSTRFQCPITGLEFNGKYKFLALRGCGHVLSVKALKEIKSSACLVCHKEFQENDKIVVNGSEEEVALLRERMEEEKAKLKEKKGKKLKNGEENVTKEVPRLSGTKHDAPKIVEKISGKVEGKNEKVAKGLLFVRDVNGGQNQGSLKRFKAADVVPANATKEVYESIFTSSKKSNFKETYSCRSLPLGRN